MAAKLKMMNRKPRKLVLAKGLPSTIHYRNYKNKKDVYINGKKVVDAEQNITKQMAKIASTINDIGNVYKKYSDSAKQSAYKEVLAASSKALNRTAKGIVARGRYLKKSLFNSINEYLRVIKKQNKKISKSAKKNLKICRNNIKSDLKKKGLATKSKKVTKSKKK